MLYYTCWIYFSSFMKIEYLKPWYRIDINLANFSCYFLWEIRCYLSGKKGIIWTASFTNAMVKQYFLAACWWTYFNLIKPVVWIIYITYETWWRHQIETFPHYWLFVVNDEFPAQWPVMQSFDVFFDQHLNKQLSKQSWGWWFETPSCWRPCNAINLTISKLVIINLLCEIFVLWLVWFVKENKNSVFSACDLKDFRLW